MKTINWHECLRHADNPHYLTIRQSAASPDKTVRVTLPWKHIIGLIRHMEACKSWGTYPVLYTLNRQDAAWLLANAEDVFKTARTLGVPEAR